MKATHKVRVNRRTKFVDFDKVSPMLVRARAAFGVSDAEIAAELGYSRGYVREAERTGKVRACFYHGLDGLLAGQSATPLAQGGNGAAETEPETEGAARPETEIEKVERLRPAVDALPWPGRPDPSIREVLPAGELDALIKIVGIHVARAKTTEAYEILGRLIAERERRGTIARDGQACDARI